MNFNVGDLVCVKKRQGYIENKSCDCCLIRDKKGVQFFSHTDEINLIKSFKPINFKEFNIGALDDDIIFYKIDKALVIVIYPFLPNEVSIYIKNNIKDVFEPDIDKEIHSLIKRNIFFNTPRYQQYKLVLSEKLKYLEVYNVQNIQTIDSMALN